MSGLQVAVVGATGAVGNEMIRILNGIINIVRNISMHQKSINYAYT